MDTVDMGGSDPSVIKELQQADENPFPETHFDGKGKSDDPLENLKNQVRSPQRPTGLACLTLYTPRSCATAVRTVSPPNSCVGVRMQVQLSCYGDAVGGNLRALKSFLDNKVSGK